MKRLLFGAIVAALTILAAPAFAVCPSTLQLKDNAGVTAPGKYVDDGSGNCQPQVVIGPLTGEVGTPGTGISQPTGGVGLSGWLSGIYQKLSNVLTVTQTPCSPYHLSGGTTASNNASSVKAAAGTLCDGIVVNTSASLAYLKIYDSATPPTCSSATGLKHVYPIPYGPSNIGAGVGPSHAMGETYLNGIAFCVTGGGADTDNSNAPAGIFVEIAYK